MKAGGTGSNDIARRLAGRLPFGTALIRALYPPMPTLNIIPQPVLDDIRARVFASGSVILNVGSGGADGCGRRLWQSTADLDVRILALDLGPGTGIDLVADAAGLPFGNEQLDTVILQAVLEHVPEPDEVIAEAFRVLRPGGHLYLEVPFLQGFHADPHDYQRYTLEGLRRKLRRFDEVRCGVSVGPFCTLVWILRDMASSWATNALVYAACRFAAGWALAPFRYLDLLVGDGKVGRRLANEFYYLARKPGGSGL